MGIATSEGTEDLQMSKVILIGTLLLVPSLVGAQGFVFASPKTGGNPRAHGVDNVRATRSRGCDPSYPTICLPAAPPDLNCSDIGFANFPVVGRDPHRLDGDRDGVGCGPAKRR
jgi:hypothetical protein